MDVTSDTNVVAVRKALHHSYQSEASRMKERNRQEMAKQRRQQMENERLIKIKMRELKNKEREISKRYEHVKTRVTYDAQVVRNSDSLPKGCANPRGKEKVTLLPNRNQRYKATRYEYEAYRLPKGKGKEKIVLLPSAIPELNMLDHEDLVKTDRLQKNQLPSLPTAHNSEYKEAFYQSATCMENAGNISQTKTAKGAVYKLPKQDFTSVMPSDQKRDIVGEVLDSLPVDSKTTSEMDWTRDVIEFYKGGLYLAEPSVTVPSGPWKYDKYEMLLLDARQAEQIRVEQVNPQDLRSKYDILTIENETGGLDSQEE